MPNAICYKCMGRGKFRTYDEYGWGMSGGITTCNICNGNGYILTEKIKDQEKYKQYILEHCLNIDD